ncbi:gamma-glutamylcyclotransferase [Streptomyces sp. RS10V-4]|uniref:gamma-glutamylcyclotransferase family protein n=1 Tax=Streptomyces rhizoryzae TaxID=2932493 RepID=UPI00200611B8|nr:gamma-glutamylcyclotransferase family protein [Streptomyces rhizoryzae]MCK7627179.1 gamma-glutamylcyclotransferase [Streptomyces rhizoryzae]
MTTEAERLPFFVYGTLRPGEANYARTLRGRTAAEEPATLSGVRLYAGPGYPYATAGPAGAVVHGTLIRPRDADYDAVRAALDRLEGYTPGARAGNLYVRVAADARCADGRTERAWVYLAAEPLAGRLRATGTPLPGGRWTGRAEPGAPG